METKKIFPAILMLALIVVMSSCKKKETPDAVAPVISFIGDGTVSIILGNIYADAGATASDDIDGDITASIITTNNVNTELKGTYSVTYSVTDAAGNTATATRTVKVLNSADYLAGGYSVSEVVTGNNSGTHNFNVSVATSDSINNVLFIRNFGEFGSSVAVEISLIPADSSLNITSQSPLFMANPGTITGSGTSNTSITFIIYNCSYTGGGNDVGSATYTKL